MYYENKIGFGSENVVFKLLYNSTTSNLLVK